MSVTGAGILIQIPHDYFASVCEFELPAPGYYAAGMAFLPSENAHAAAAAIEQIVESEGLRVIGWREVPTDPSTLGSFAVDAMPVFRTLFIGDPADETDAFARTGTPLIHNPETNRT